LSDERLDLLALCTEGKRLSRAEAERKRVHLQIDGPDLFLAAVSSYNVVLDLQSRRIQHGCRDFLGQARDGRLCKHVAALLLAIDEEVAITVLRDLTDPDGGWHLEVIGARGFGS
jgi:hypothetical protein